MIFQTLARKRIRSAISLLWTRADTVLKTILYQEYDYRA